MSAKFGKKQKRVFTVVATLIASLFLPFFGITAVNAAPNISWIDKTADTVLHIHKFEQPDALGEPATGLIQDTSGLVPVQGAKFQATLVPGIDITTNNGWDTAAAMTAAEARDLIGSAIPDATGVTGSTGDVSLGLKVGLYYIEEISVPAGVVAIDPFLVVMPIPHPTGDEWLYDVHIYPKNPRVTIKLDVFDSDAIKIGDNVKWTSKSTIPSGGVTDAYVVQNLINPKLKLKETSEEVQVKLSQGNESLVYGDDYTTKIIQLDGKETIEVVFTEKGREKLARVKNNYPGAHVEITYNTQVLQQGEINNEARVLPDQRAVLGQTPPVVDYNVTKFGPIKIKVHEKGVPSHTIPNSKFYLYSSAEDAKADRNRIVINGVDHWETDENGMITIDGLRFSNFANGLDLDKNDPLFQYYYAMPISYPAGWKGDKNPLQGTVTSVDDPEVLIAVVWKDVEPPKPPLSTTGGQIVMALAIGAVLMAGGAVALTTGRKRQREDDIQ